MSVNITLVQLGVCWESDGVSLMQNCIHPGLPVAAAADIVFHIRPACWQRAWHPLFSLPLLPLFTSSPHSFLSPTHILPLLLLDSDQPECCSDVVCSSCPAEKQVNNKKNNCPSNHFDDIIVATHVNPTCLSSWVVPTAVCVCIHTLPLLLNSRVQLQAAAQEVVVKMVLFRQKIRNIDAQVLTHTHPQWCEHRQWWHYHSQ